MENKEKVIRTAVYVNDEEVDFKDFVVDLNKCLPKYNDVTKRIDYHYPDKFVFKIVYENFTEEEIKSAEEELKNSIKELTEELIKQLKGLK